MEKRIVQIADTFAAAVNVNRDIIISLIGIVALFALVYLAFKSLR